MDNATDPVLEREMFRPRSKAVKEDGIASVSTPDKEMTERKKLAAAMLEEAKKAQDPSNFTTLDAQDKPAVFRPIAAQATQAPQPNTMQQIQQMQAMGLRPVGMAKGGHVQHFADGSGPNGVMPTVSLPYDTSANSAVEYNQPDDITTWTDDYMAAVAKKKAVENDKYANDPGYFNGPPVSDDMRDPEKIFLMFKRQKAAAELGKENKNADERMARGLNRPSLEGSIFGNTKKDIGDFQNVTADLDYDKREKAAAKDRIDEQTAAGIAALPDKRDYASERNYEKNVADDALARLQAAPDKRDYASERLAQADLNAKRYASPTSEGVPGSAAEARRITGVPGAAVAVGAETPESVSKAPASPASPVVSGPTKGPDSVIPAEAPDKTPTTLEGIKADRENERKQNLGLAMMQAGLAMAAGRSPNAITNIAEGGISGLKAFTESESESRKAQREAQRLALEDQRANRQFEEQRRQFGMTFGEAGRRFDIENDRANRQMQIAADQFDKTYGLSAAAAARDEDHFKKTFGLSVDEAKRKTDADAAEQTYKAGVLANDKEKLAITREELKNQTEQAIATRDAKKLETSSQLAQQVLNATEARIASLRASQRQNAMMGIKDEAVEAEIKELGRQADEARQNYYAVQKSLGINLPGAENDPLGLRGSLGRQ